MALAGKLIADDLLKRLVENSKAFLGGIVPLVREAVGESKETTRSVMLESLGLLAGIVLIGLPVRETTAGSDGTGYCSVAFCERQYVS
jgi:hypothetical protein